MPRQLPLLKGTSGLRCYKLVTACRELMACNLFHPMGRVNQVKPPQRGNSWNFSQSPAWASSNDFSCIPIEGYGVG